MLPRKFHELGQAPQIPLDRLLEAGDDAWVELLAAVPSPAPSDFLGFRALPRRIAERQHTDLHVPPIRVYRVSEAHVAGDSHAIKCGNVVSAPLIHPPYVRHSYFQQWIDLPDVEHRPSRAIAGPVLLVTNYNSGQYGHFLLECLPKVFVAKYLHELGFDIPVLLPSNLPAFAREIMKLAHPPIRLLEFDVERDAIAPQMLLLPSLCHDSYLFHPSCVAFMRAFVRASPSGGPVRKRIFISRSRLHKAGRPFRHISNIEQIEELAINLGCEVVHPQELSFPDQVRLFAGASLVIGEYGSGLHNTIFSRPGTRILAINWLNDVQQRLAQSCGHDIGFVLPDDNQPRWHEIADPASGGFEIDAETFMAALANMCLGDIRLPPLKWFDEDYYLLANADVLLAGFPARRHYDTHGWREGRDPSPNFSTVAYLEDNPDVREQDVNPLTHYLSTGRYEGRIARPASKS